jgi:hypothetical protein
MATDDPTIAVNSGSAQKGKLTSWQTEYVLREIEEKNLNRKLFIPQLFAESGSEEMQWTGGQAQLE